MQYFDDLEADDTLDLKTETPTRTDSMTETVGSSWETGRGDGRFELISRIGTTRKGCKQPAGRSSSDGRTAERAHVRGCVTPTPSQSISIPPFTSNTMPVIQFDC